jgi:peroxiredoxin family protein
MAQKLGILVASDEHFEHLVGICRAAAAAGKEVEVFLTNEGVRLTGHQDFPALAGLCRVRLCNIGFERRGLAKPVPGVADEDFGTQMRNAMLLEESDRYLVL